MLGTDYHKVLAQRGPECLASHEFSALEVVTIGGRQLYRAVRSEKCKRCRKMMKRPGAFVAFAHGHGNDVCQSCGNPYCHVFRHRRIHTNNGWEFAPDHGGGSTVHWQGIRGH